MMAAYKKGIVDVAEREAFTELSKLLRTTHLEHQQFPREPLSEALETTAKLFQRSAAMHFREVSVGIAAPFLQTQQLAEHLATVAADFVERGHPPNQPGPGDPAEVLLRGAGDDDARASCMAFIHGYNAPLVPSTHPTTTSLRMQAAKVVKDFGQM